MQINSKEDLKLYVLRRCGYPVIKINVEENQLQDRLDDAISYFQSYSSEAQMETFYKQTITQTDKTNRFVTLPPDIIAIKQVLPISPSFFPSWMSPEYQTFIMELKDLMSGSVDSYFITQRHLSLLNFLLSKAGTTFSFNSYTSTISLNLNWDQFVADKSFLILEVAKKISPDQYPNLFNSYYLKELAYYFVLKQWATNLKKYSNVPLPGGVTLNAQEMLDEATSAITTVTDQMKMSSDSMPFFLVG